MTEHAQYNSQEKPLLFRAYGRLVEEMVKKNVLWLYFF